MDEARLLEKLRLIEALHAGATSDGERNAAELARARILERLRAVEREDPPVEYKFSLADRWTRKVFVSLLRRYGIRPYRYSRQRHTTVMARVPKRFVDETLWPEFQEISSTLQLYLAEVTDRVVQQVISQDTSDAEVVEDPKQLGTGTPDGRGHEPEQTSLDMAPASASPPDDPIAEGTGTTPLGTTGSLGPGKWQPRSKKRKKGKRTK